MSQVHEKPLIIALDKLATEPRVQIVLVQNLKRSEVFRKVIFPKESRYDRCEPWKARSAMASSTR